MRGKAWKMTVRIDAKPPSRPFQNGELAERAIRIGTLRRSPLRSRIASSGFGTPTCTCNAIVGSRRASERSESPSRR